MRRFSLIIVTLLASIWISGCAKPTDPAAATNPNGQNPNGQTLTSLQANGGVPQPKLVIARNAGPDVVVSTFLEQTRAGNDASATELLTVKAREETAKENLTLDLPVSPTMKFSIAKVEYLEGNKDAAYVNSVWTETFEKGEGNNFEIVWVLRRQAEGWRIAGMSAQNTPEEPPIFLNFEDPEHVQLIKEKISNGEPGQGDPNGQPPANGVAPPAANGATANGFGQIQPANGQQPPANGQFQPANGFGQPQQLPPNGQQQNGNGFGQQPNGNGFGQKQPPNNINPPPANYGGQFPANAAQNTGPAPRR